MTRGALIAHRALLGVALAALLHTAGGCGDEGTAAETTTDASTSDGGGNDAVDAGTDGSGADAGTDGSGADDATDAPTSDDAADTAQPDAADPDTAEPDAEPDAELVEDAAIDAPSDLSDDTAPATPCEAGETLRFGADVPADGIALAAEFGTCSDAAHSLVAGAASSWQVEATELPERTVVSVYPARYFADRAAGVETLPLGTSAPARSGIARATFEAPASGEYVVVLDRPAASATATYRVAAQCRAKCTVEATRYPIVLLHGYAGVDSYFGILDYFHDVRPTLNRAGYVAYAPVVAPIATSERRVEQLVPQLEAILLETGARKLNLVAHSQGGIDARLLVSAAGWSDRIASVTTIATPHRGIPLLLADFLSVHDFSPEAAEEFNAAHPDVEGVQYWSWSSRSCGILEPRCREESANELVDVLLGASYTLLLRFGENDGIVPTASMPWGEHLGLLFADHFDEVGQIADGSPDDDPFDHRAFYLSEARRLRDAGL